MDRRLKMPSELVQIRLNYTLPDGDQGNNIVYMVHKDCTADGGAPQPFTDTLAASQASRVVDAFGTNLAAFRTNYSSLDSADWTWNENVNTGPLHIGNVTTDGTPYNGTASGVSLPSGMSIACRMQTGLGGRGNHGRVFLPELSESLVASSDYNSLTPTAYSDLVAALAATLADINNNDCALMLGDQYELVVVSFILHDALRATASYHSVTAWNLKDAYLDYQRRRAPAHSRHH